MKKNPFAYFLIFMLFYVLWLLKGEEILEVGAASARPREEVRLADERPELEASIRFAWLLGY